MLALETFFEGPAGRPCILGIYDDAELRERVSRLHSSLFSDVANGSLHPERIALAMMMIDGKWAGQQFKTVYSTNYKNEILKERMKLIDAMDID